VSEPFLAAFFTLSRADFCISGVNGPRSVNISSPIMIGVKMFFRSWAMPAASFAHTFQTLGLHQHFLHLQPEIQLWDYASWVDTVKAVVNENISSLRETLVKNDLKLKSALEEVKKIANPDSFKVVATDKSLVFNLMKYDYKKMPWCRI
jgi:hypothetical protein